MSHLIFVYFSLNINVAASAHNVVKGDFLTSLQTLCLFHLKWFYPNSVRNVNDWTFTLDTYYILVCPGPKVGHLPSSTTPPCCSLFCARNFIPISDHEKIWILGQLATRRFCKPSNWWRVRISPSRFLFLCVLHSEAQRGHWTLDTTWVAYEIHNYDDAPELSVFHFSNPSLSVCRK